MVYLETIWYTKEKYDAINEYLNLCSKMTEFVLSHDELVGDVIPFLFTTKVNSCVVYKAYFDNDSQAELCTDVFGLSPGAKLIWRNKINKDIEQEMRIGTFNELKTVVFTVNDDIYIVEIKIED